MSDRREKYAIDLFSGFGGLSQGLKDAGFKILACCEIRPEAREAYRLNHGNVEAIEDIRESNPIELMEKLSLQRGDLDLLAGCPPCQGFSSIRTHNHAAADDERNELIFQVVRFVEAFYPKFILIENVPRLLQDVRLVRFKEMLSPLGYKFADGVLDAQNFGVPQRRKRMILVGSRFGDPALPRILDGERKTVRVAIKGLKPPKGKDGVTARRLVRFRQHFSPEVLRRIKSVKSSRTDLPDDLVLDCHKKYPRGFRDVYGRMDWDDVAPTITRSSHNPSKGRFIHPSLNRGLNMFEALVLQGFPPTYKIQPGIGLGKVASMIGEAFPPPMAKAQASCIMEQLCVIEKRQQGGSIEHLETGEGKKNVAVYLRSDRTLKGQTTCKHALRHKGV